MGDQQNISQILAALAAAGKSSAPPPPTTHAGGYALPQPDSTGSLNIGSVASGSAGSVSIAEAIAKARGIAAEKGITYKPTSAQTRDNNPRSYRRSRSPSRTPPPRTSAGRDVFRDGYNPYRDERRGADRRGAGDRGYGRERSSSPRPDARGGDTFSPPTSRHYRPSDRSPPPRTRPAEDNSETIEIDNKLVGLIIGRQGENLRRIENDTGARVQFLDSAEHNKGIRLCRISGSKQIRDEAKAEIDRVVNEGDRSRGGGGQQSGQDGGRTKTADVSGADSMQIMVPDRTVGLVIGRSGETIKDLQERSGCRVNIARDGESVNGLRPVSLSGSQQAMQRAKDLILGIVESDSRQGGTQQQREPRGQPAGAENGGGGGDKVNETIFIPRESVGMVIGKGGDTIKEIQNYSGCKINISPLVGREPEREVTLVGAQTAIDAAKRAIMAKVEASKTRSQGPRRDDSYGGQQPYQQQQMPQQQPPYSQDPSSQQQAMQPNAEGVADPYAMYGGYENYMAMWYAAMAQQQQQQYQQQSGGGQPPPPSGSDQPGPPGVS